MKLDLVYLIVGIAIEGMSSGSKLTLFHMNGCPHCVKMMPEWDKFSKLNPGKTQKHEASDVQDLTKKLNIQGFPTIMLLDANNNKIPLKNMMVIEQQQDLKHLLKLNNIFPLIEIYYFNMKWVIIATQRSGIVFLTSMLNFIKIYCHNEYKFLPNKSWKRKNHNEFMDQNSLKDNNGYNDYGDLNKSDLKGKNIIHLIRKNVFESALVNG